MVTRGELNHLFFVALTLLSSMWTFSHTQKVVTSGAEEEAVHVQAVSGGNAELPCDISTQQLNDSVLLVVWYREELPIYSWDVRSPTVEDEDEDQVFEGDSDGDATPPEGAHWSGAWGERARWMPQQAHLLLRPAGPEDRGEYRCRADFRASPTRNTRVNLEIIEAVGTPVISSSAGVKLSEFAGPFREGDTPILTCTSRGGKPPATVRWYRGGRLLESGAPAIGHAVLRLSPLQRSDLLASLSCHATNSPLLPPATATIQIDMKMAPMSIDVRLAEGEALSAGRPQDIICKSTGARPPSKLSLWLNSVQLYGKQQDSVEEMTKPEENSIAVETESSEEKYVSTLTVRVVANSSQHGQRIICRADHDLLSAPLEKSLGLNVLFPPSVKLSLGAKLNPNDIEEGDDVYFECNVTAHPPPYKQLWEHDGKPLQGDTKAGVTISSGNLVLRNVTRAAAGAYTCTASNVEGDARSQPVHLKIMYKPVCSSHLRRSYGVGRQERVQLVCEVESVPPPDSFTWALNNSAQLLPVAPERYTFTKQPAKSVLTFTPLSDMDYGTALCWASNLVGRQLEPCALTLIPAARPHAPVNCTLANLTSAALEVLCEDGWDGGLPQRFQLEVWELTEDESRADRLLTNISSGKPAFSVGGLQAGRALRLVLYAHNSRGRSPALTLDAYTLEIAERIVDGDVSNLDVAKVAGVCGGVLAALILLALITVLALRMRSHSMHTNSHYSVNKHHKNTRSELQQQINDDKNPDVVPLNKDNQRSKSGAERETGAPLVTTASDDIEGSLPRPPPYSRVPPLQPTQLPINRVGREVVTTRAPLPATQESDV